MQKKKNKNNKTCLSEKVKMRKQKSKSWVFTLPLAVTLIDVFKALKEQLQLLLHNKKERQPGNYVIKSFFHNK